MAKATKAPASNGSQDVRTLTVVQPRTPVQWGVLLRKAAEEHWRRLRVTIQLREWLMAGKPAQLDAATAMLKARGLEAAIEAVNVEDPDALAAAASSAVDEGLCEFHRRPGRPGCWFPTNNVKAGLKENWSVLGKRSEHKGSNKALAEGVFVTSVPTQDTSAPAERDWLYLAAEPAGVYTGVSHTIGIRGPVSSIKRHEYMIAPRLMFEIALSRAIQEKLPDLALADTLIHFGEHGLGACRSQGYGKFDVVEIAESAQLTPATDATDATEAAKIEDA